LRQANYNDGRQFDYTYDAVGNRLTQTVDLGQGNPVVTNYQYDTANRLEYVNDQAYTWDNNGNLLNDGASGYTYDHADRLKSASEAGLIASYNYNGMGNRLQQTVSGATSNYTLDLAGGLTQVLGDGTQTYLYGNGRIAQYTETTPEYFLGDALGSVRQLVDGSGNVALAKEYEPYGEVMNSAGTTSTALGFTGEWTDNTGLVYLRARYYDPTGGRFMTRDSWGGDMNQPITYDPWLYAFSNPINRTDPTGLYSSSPIHAMIQAHYAGTYGASHIVIPEFYVPGGSKQGLELVTDPSGLPKLIGNPTGQAGYIDIVDLFLGQAFEIKKEVEFLNGLAEINWYVSVYNRNPLPGGPIQLTPGTNYKWPWEGWEIIGTNPYYSGGVILAQMKGAGVITYKSVTKDKIPVPLPKYIYEWDPNKKTVERRDLTTIPNWSPIPAPAYSNVINACKVVIIAGVTVIIIFDPLPDEPLLPLVWSLAP
jgi:RHS repeat-associated protein